jgi:hypothetical protein
VRAAPRLAKRSPQRLRVRALLVLLAALAALAVITIVAGRPLAARIVRLQHDALRASLLAADPVQGSVVAETAPPSESALRAQAGLVPPHVLTWIYYAEVHINEDVPPDIVARYADFVEDDRPGEYAAKFKRAGGRYALAYEDPTYVAYCDPPFTPPAGSCKPPFYKYLDESAWFHGKDGARVHHYVPGDHQYQEAVNPASPVAQRGWHAFTEDIHRNAPALDFMYADDSGGPLYAGDMSPNSSEFYGYNEAGVEIASNDVFRDAMIAYLRQTALPVVINGSDPITGLPAYGGALLRQPFVLGDTHENCFRTEENTIKTDERDRWRDEADSLLSNTALHKWAICMMEGRPTPVNRIYALASWWITYDPQWSVAAPMDPIPQQSALIPELAIVPRFPVRTAVDRVRGLRTDRGLYVREFRGCYQEHAFIGGCAAIVNPTDRTAPLPPLVGSYHRLLVLGGGDIMHGGTATWQLGSAPSIGPGAAVVLAR